MKSKKNIYVVFLIFSLELSKNKLRNRNVQIKSVLYDRKKAYELKDYYIRTYMDYGCVASIGNVYKKEEFESNQFFERLRNEKFRRKNK